MQPYKIDKPIRLIELFAGIGSQAMALRNLGADFTTYRTCEWWIQPNASYKAMESYRIRRLTPLECWRLMGFSDEDFRAAEADEINSDTQLYAQAGNSIVVNVLEAIFGEMLPKGQDMEEEPEEEPEQEKIESMDAIKQKIYELTETELKAANEKFPLFASSHETYGVIFEEFEETRDELNELESSVDRFWLGVKQNTSYIVEIDRLAEIYERAVRLAVEAIKTAAMARKGILSSYQKGDPVHGETTEN